MDLSYQKKLAAEVVGAGFSRIKFNEEYLDRIAEAVSRKEIKQLIKEGAIIVVPASRNSRGRWRIKHEKKKKGRRRGSGSRKGAQEARESREEKWVYTVRKLRRYLRWLKIHGMVDTKTYRELYLKIKGGSFKSLSDLQRHLRERGILK